MNAYTELLGNLVGLNEINDNLNKKPGIHMVSGCIDAGKAHLIYAMGEKAKMRVVVTYDEVRAKEFVEDYKVFDKNVLYYPAKDILFYQADIHGNVLSNSRIKVLKALADGESYTFVTTYDALMNRNVTPERFLGSGIKIKNGDETELEELKIKLVDMGFENAYQVEASGQFSVRGGILDIYPVGEDNPYRIEFWGDEVDSIRSFDAESQRSIENLDEIEIYPASDILLTGDEKEAGLKKIKADTDRLYKKMREDMKTEEAYRLKTACEEITNAIRDNADMTSADAYLPYFTDETVSFLDFFSDKDTLFFLDEAQRCVERGTATETEFNESMKHRLEKGYVLPGQLDALIPHEQIAAALGRRKTIILMTLEQKVKDFEVKSNTSVQMKSIYPYNNSFELLIKDLKRYGKQKYSVLLMSGSRSRARRLADDIMNEGVNCFFSEETKKAPKPGTVQVCYGKLKRGFEYPGINFAIVSESDIFGQEKKKKKRKKNYDGDHINIFSELSIGDYVVHENHGLGIYKGIEKIEVDHVVKDYIKVEYAKGSNLYILATQLDMLQKYSGGGENKKIKLNRLGGNDWVKTKTRVQSAVKEIAEDLVELYAKRQEMKGFVYGEDTVWQKEFEEMFPFEETEDQTEAIEATKRDMESTKIMDRLICGDVGYGKTEIAIRAAFKATQEGKQVAYLVPTTILAEQHYNTFCQRMKDYPIQIELLCRFRTPSEIKASISRLKKGTADIVIGTHRLLSKDVVYKDLGLLIIDEEQRFGVRHKEAIKKLKNDVDVLTLTATPIPRTLHMSLVGIRDMSVLEEPPMDRLPIQTYVMEYNEEMIREAIGRELARGGQVYYVFNRVKQIEDMTARIASLVPEANVAFAHGQMSERELENIMYSFVNGETDVLVSTTIIETGLDISNVNTIIIHDADNLGLSQLYQLRGRVGRSSRTAYAFLMYKRDKMLKEVAEKRLAAIKEYTELGSGIRIAMRDLEIRGAGSLLGEVQHGHIEAVGYDLYCKMLNDEVRKLKGEASDVDYFETSIDIEIDAYIPSTYITVESTKLETYKRIAGIENEEEREEMTEELIDRFGDPPKSVMNLMRIAEYRAKAHGLYFTDISQKNNEVHLKLYEKAPIRVEKIPEFLGLYGSRMKFIPDRKIPEFIYTMHINSRDKETPEDVIRDVLENAGEVLINKSCESV
ncbi:MAG: transcription-repair coupling factor [Lachnospiraceae bacterium]|nr:transcription-repair coupling factor [Lachnospiraceae bacterium]